MKEERRSDHQRRAVRPTFRVSIFDLSTVRRFDRSRGIAGLVGRPTRRYANDDIWVGSFYIAAVGPFLIAEHTEVYIFRLREGRIVHAWGIEDTLGRLEQLGLR